MVECKDCKYSKVVDEQRYCLRFPPAIRLANPGASGYVSSYPEVENNWRCGEGETE